MQEDAETRGLPLQPGRWGGRLGREERRRPSCPRKCRGSEAGASRALSVTSCWYSEKKWEELEDHRDDELGLKC